MATGVDRDQLGCCNGLHELLVNHPDILAATGVCSVPKKWLLPSTGIV